MAALAGLRNDSRGPRQEPPPVAAPPGSVVMRFVPARVHPFRQRGSVIYRDTTATVPGFVAVVRGVRFDDPDEAMRFADRLADTEGRGVWIET